MRTLLLRYLILSFSVCLTSAIACEGTIEAPCTTFSHRSPDTPLKSFRFATDMMHYSGINHYGVKNLKISASGAPSGEAFSVLKAHILERNPGINTITIVDLRLESHLYLNGRGITLTSTENWLNKNRNTEEVLKQEANWKQQLRTSREVKNILMAQQFKSGERQGGATIPVRSVEQEKTLVRKNGMRYRRLGVLDHCVPQDTIVDAYVTLVHKQKIDEWIHLHCHGGKGRTSTFLVMYDMLLNAPRVSYDEIMQRHQAIPPFYNLRKKREANKARIACYDLRTRFTKLFYDYAQQGAPKGQRWSQWIQQQSSEDAQLWKSASLSLLTHLST